MAGKVSKRHVSTKQKASDLFRLWHNIQDIKSDAEDIADSELVLLVGMVELLVEERIAGLKPVHGARLTAVEVAHAY